MCRGQHDLGSNQILVDMMSRLVFVYHCEDERTYVIGVLIYVTNIQKPTMSKLKMVLTKLKTKASSDWLYFAQSFILSFDI